MKRPTGRAVLRCALSGLAGFVSGYLVALATVLLIQELVLAIESTWRISWDAAGPAGIAVTSLAFLLTFAVAARLVFRWTGGTPPTGRGLLRHVVAAAAGLGGLVAGFFLMVLTMMGVIWLLLTGGTKGGYGIAAEAAVAGGLVGAAAGFTLAYWWGLRQGRRAVPWSAGIGVGALAVMFLLSRLPP